MPKKCCKAELEIPVSELKLQLDYANTISSDLFNIFAPQIPDISGIIREYFSIQTKLSMLLDFIFQAKAWCDTLYPKKCNNKEKEENKEEKCEK